MIFIFFTEQLTTPNKSFQKPEISHYKKKKNSNKYEVLCRANIKDIYFYEKAT